ncbi:MAG: hypothetical protein U1F76_25955 [Candidatus Competibacteraceae bacterium]
MAYNEFTLESAEAELGVVAHPGDLFPNLSSIPVPSWLQELLARSMQLALISEKARSEFIVAPILLACRELSGNALTILSGQRLDVDPVRKLQGECDFILALSEPVPRLRAPLVTIVEAKRNDIESGLGQCIAQMVGAQLYNERAAQAPKMIYGCVTTGEDWQFLQLQGTTVLIGRQRLYIDNVGRILAVFQAIFAHARSET